MESTTAPVEDSTLFGTRLQTLSIFVLFLAMFDCFMTVQLLSGELAVELNPLMAWLYDSGGALAFVFAKMTLTALCLLWICKRASPDQARMGALAALTIYLPVAGCQALSATMVL